MFDVSTNARLEARGLLDRRIDTLAIFQRAALIGAHGNVLRRVTAGVGVLGRALLAGIAERVGLRAVEQALGLDDVVNIGSCSPDGMHQPGVGVHADVGLHPEMPLVGLLGRSRLNALATHHLGVERTLGLLGRGGRSDQRGIYHRADLQQPPLALHHLVDRLKDLLGESLLLDQVAKTEGFTEAQHPALVEQARVVVQTAELSKNCCTSCSTSSLAGSLSMNHCCMRWTRSIVPTANGDRPRPP